MAALGIGAVAAIEHPSLHCQILAHLGLPARALDLDPPAVLTGR